MRPTWRVVGAIALWLVLEALLAWAIDIKAYPWLNIIISIIAGLAMMAAMYLPLNLSHVWLNLGLFAVATPIQFWAGRSIYSAALAAASQHFEAAVGHLSDRRH